MKTILLACFLLSVATHAADQSSDLTLVDGSRIKGRILSSTASEVTVSSDFGTLRIALDKLTTQSREQVAAQTKPTQQALLARIAELEAKLSQLQQENETLRKQALNTSPSSFRPSGSSSLMPAGNAVKPAASGAQYTISSTGKRHNSHCRYFGTGRACGPTDGTPCKICGG